MSGRGELYNFRLSTEDGITIIQFKRIELVKGTFMFFNAVRNKFNVPVIVKKIENKIDWDRVRL